MSVRNLLDSYLKTAAEPQTHLPGSTAGDFRPAGHGRDRPPVGQSLGITGLPWRGAALGAGAGALYNLLYGDEDDSTLRSALRGALVGAGGEYGVRVGGEAARRHALHGGSGLTTGLAPLLATGLGAGAGGILGGILAPQRSRRESRGRR